MGRTLQFSVPFNSAPWHSTDDRPEDSYLEAIADVDATVELFRPEAYAHHLVPVKRTLDAHDLEVGSIHGNHLQRLLDDDDRGVNSFFTRLRHLHLASVIDRTPDHRLEPDVSTHHAPRFWPREDPDFEAARRVFLERLADAVSKAEPNPGRDDLDSTVYDGSRITATVALENVAPRGPHQYLLVTPEDVEALVATADTLGVKDAFGFTCDVGHSTEPRAVLEAMHDVQNVHLHSTVTMGTERARRVRERYDIPTTDAIGPEDRPGVAHHLPPHVGDLDLPGILNTLDDIDYDAPLTIELASIYHRPAVVTEVADALNRYQ
jgi:sugar phosphate isomerase/epimerase